MENYNYEEQQIERLKEEYFFNGMFTAGILIGLFLTLIGVIVPVK